MFNPSRDEARRFLIDAWKKHRAGEPLTGLEQVAAALVARHPEYHAILEAPERNLERDWQPESGDVNPFLHLSLHLAVAEQLSIDQPPGIRAEYERIRGGERRRARGAARGARVPRGGHLECAAARHAAGSGALSRLPGTAGMKGGGQCLAVTVAGCEA